MSRSNWPSAFSIATPAPSATIVADDYGGWPGAKAAIDEWLEKTRRKVRIYPLRIGPAVLRLQD